MSIDRSVDRIRIRLHSDNLPGGIPFSHPLIIVTLEGQHEHSGVIPGEIARFSYVDASGQWQDVADPEKIFTVDQLYQHLLHI
jgi:hypothetical protein